MRHVSHALGCQNSKFVSLQIWKLTSADSQSSEAFLWPQTERCTLCMFGSPPFSVRSYCVTSLPIRSPQLSQLAESLSQNYSLFLTKSCFNNLSVCHQFINNVGSWILILFNGLQSLFSLFLCLFFCFISKEISKFSPCVLRQVSISLVWFQRFLPFWHKVSQVCLHFPLPED